MTVTSTAASGGLDSDQDGLPDAWELAKDETAGVQCKPYGVGNIIRQPGRIHITWQDENTLRVDTDAADPALTYEIHDAADALLHSRTIRLSTLHVP